MAVVSDRQQLYTSRMDSLKLQKTQLLEQVSRNRWNAWMIAGMSKLIRDFNELFKVRVQMYRWAENIYVLFRPKVLISGTRI